MEHNVNNLFRMHMKNEKFQVKDYIVPDMKMLFILESPNEEALKNGMPATGRIGKFMVRGLNFPPQMAASFGELIQWHPELGISVMNTMDTVWKKNMGMPKEYGCDKTEWMRLMRKIYEIKHVEFVEMIYFLKKYEEEIIEPILESYINRLSEYLRQVKDENFVIFVCGRFSCVIMEYYVKEGFEIPEDCLIIPLKHPSYNWWLRDETERIEFAREVVQEKMKPLFDKSASQW